MGACQPRRFCDPTIIDDRPSPRGSRPLLKASWASQGDMMAIQQTPQADEFKEQLRDSLVRETVNSRAVESGQVKLLMLSSDGKECLLAIHGPGDVFGELCLSGLGTRLETATAMKQT